MSASQQQSAFSYSVPPYANLPIKNITSAYTVQPNDNGFIINCTSGTFTVSLTAAVMFNAGFNCWVWNTSTTSSNVITIDPNGTETIDGRATLVLRRGEGMQIICNKINWQTGDKKVMRGYAENFDSSDIRPTASGDGALALGKSASASSTNGIAIGWGAFASATTSSIAIGSNVTASASYNTSIGTNSGTSGSQAVTGSGAMALGGSYASGADSLAAAVANNTSSYGAKGPNSVAIGYFTNATGGECVAMGSNTTASSTWSFAFGAFCQATQAASVALGVYALSNISGKHVYSGGRFATTGDAQAGTFAFRRATTDATSTVLTTNSSAADATNQVVLPNNSAYAFTGTVVARRQAAGGTESAAWKIEGLIRREGTAASTTLVASTVTAISNVPGWTLALSADTTNGGLAITATGAAATNIRWVATVQTSEVTYA